MTTITDFPSLWLAPVRGQGQLPRAALPQQEAQPLSMADGPAAISCSRGAVVGIGARALIATARFLDGASAADVALHLRRGIGWLREEPLNISEPCS